MCDCGILEKMDIGHLRIRIDETMNEITQLKKELKEWRKMVLVNKEN